MYNFLKSLLIGVTLLIPIQAYAGMTCGRALVDIGNQGGVTSTYVDVVNSNWTVLHTLKSGEVVNRSLQYIMIDKSTDSKLQWEGPLITNPHIVMVGEIKHIPQNGQLTYNEWVFKNGTVIMHSVSICDARVKNSNNIEMPSGSEGGE